MSVLQLYDWHGSVMSTKITKLLISLAESTYWHDSRIFFNWNSVDCCMKYLTGSSSLEGSVINMGACRSTVMEITIVLQVFFFVFFQQQCPTTILSRPGQSKLGRQPLLACSKPKHSTHTKCAASSSTLAPSWSSSKKGACRSDISSSSQRQQVILILVLFYNKK